MSNLFSSDKMQAIPTEYHGYRFRSRLEARWALFLDTAGIRFDYEPEGYQYNAYSDTAKYLPDFILPDYNVFAEVKGQFKDWQADFRRVCRFVTPDLNARGILILTTVPAPRAVNHTSVYWYPFLFYNPLKERAEITRVTFRENDGHVSFCTDLGITDWHTMAVEEYMSTGSYDGLNPIADTDICKTGAGVRDYPIRLSDYQTPILDDAIGRARRADFNAGN